MNRKSSRSRRRTKEIKTLGKQKDRLLARKKVIEQLQANRSQMVHLFDSLVRTIPDGVALANIKQEGEILTLEGRAQSNARVSAYMRNLESSGWMTNPDLSIIEAKGEDKTAAGTVSSDVRALPYVFTLQVKLANPNAPDEEGGVAPAGSPASPTAPRYQRCTGAPRPLRQQPPHPPPTGTCHCTGTAADNHLRPRLHRQLRRAEQPAPATQGRPES